MPQDNPSNSLRLGTITRGNGKVFALIETNTEIASCEASSSTLDDKTIPAKVKRLDSGELVLIVPALSVSQRVNLTAKNSAGEVVAKGECFVNHLEASLMSKANTLLKNPHIETLRNCDSGPTTDELTVYPLRLIAREEGVDLLHMLAFFPLYDTTTGSAPVHIDVLGPNGASIAMGDAVKLGETIEEFPQYPGVHYRAVQYSIPIAACSLWFCLNADCPDSPLAANFTCVQPHEIRSLFDAWHPVTLGYEGSDPDYEAWFRSVRPGKSELEIQRQTSDELAIKPVFSIVVPLYHTPLNFFADMVRSVLDQSYPYWELVLVNSTPEDAELAQAVDELARADERVRVVTLDHNLGITENTNAGIDVATGDFISFFDHDDLIEPDLLYWYVRGINDYPNTDMLYCDEDKLFEGHYIEPFYKPDWSPLFLETNNYVCHLLTVRRSVIDSLPRPTAEFDGAQDHRLALAAGELARNVYHARRMLYHWRIHALSTAADGEAKPESLVAGRLAIDTHFERLGIHAHLEDLPKSPHCYVPVYDDVALPTISAVVAPSSSDQQVYQTVASLEALKLDNLQVITCGAAQDPSSINTQLAQGIEKATGDYLLLLAAGTTVPNLASLEQLAAVAMRPDVAIACPKTVLPDGTNYRNGLVFHNGNFFVLNRFFYSSFNADRAITVLPHDVTAGTTECLMVSRETFDSLGGIDLSAPSDFWGPDLCLRARMKGLTVAQHSPSLVQHEMIADDLTLDIERLAMDSGRKRSFFLRKRAEVFCQPDRFYKPLC